MRPQGIPDNVKPIDHPVTFVTSDDGSDVHAFIPAHFELPLVHFMAENFRYTHEHWLYVFPDD